MDGITPFLHRAEDYAASRPAYPLQLMSFLRDRCGLEAGSRVADVGSGTGILTAQLLKVGATVFAVEPNESMRLQAEAALGSDPGFISVDAKAEELPFDDMVLDLITCSQSFHWFDFDRTKAEFARVLHGAGWVCCMWNELDESAGGATHHVITALRTASAESPRARESEQMKQFFAPGTMIHKVFVHEQELDLARVISLLRSRSYWPAPDSELGSKLESDILNSLQTFARKGTVKLQYRCSAFAGQMD